MSYQGHKNWTCWNVSLWINNDEFLYALALHQTAIKTKDKAAVDLLNFLHDRNMTHTPDGAKFSRSAIREAIRGM